MKKTCVTRRLDYVCGSMDINLGSMVDTIRMGLCDRFEEIKIVQLKTAHYLGASFFGGWVVRHMDGHFAHSYTCIGVVRLRHL